MTDKFWEEGISFYIDATGSQHRCNPHDEARFTRTMAWWLKLEGLNPCCTAKWFHVGLGGRVVHFILAIARKCTKYFFKVFLFEQYEEKTNGEVFSGFINAHFQETFSQCRISKSKRFLQDGWFQKANGFFKMDVLYKTVKRQEKKTLDTVGVIKFSIPHRLPDFNHIENIFNYVKSELRTRAFKKL